MNLRMGKDAKKVVHFSCRISKELKHALRIISAANEQTMSEQAELFIREGVEFFIKKNPSIETLLKKVL